MMSFQTIFEDGGDQVIIFILFNNKYWTYLYKKVLGIFYFLGNHNNSLSICLFVYFGPAPSLFVTSILPRNFLIRIEYCTKQEKKKIYVRRGH